MGQEITKQQIVDALENLPDESLVEIATFLDYLRYKMQQEIDQQTPYQPVVLGGLWAGVTISDDDIDQARDGMWCGR